MSFRFIICRELTFAILFLGFFPESMSADSSAIVMLRVFLRLILRRIVFELSIRNILHYPLGPVCYDARSPIGKLTSSLILALLFRLKVL